MNLREHIKLFRRGWQYMCHLSPRYARNLLLTTLLEALTPYIPIYFSARIVDELHSGVGHEVLAIYVAITVGGAFLLSLLITYLHKRQEGFFTELFWGDEWSYSEKAMAMDYAHIETRETKLLLERVRKESQTGFNLWYYQNVVKHVTMGLVRIIASLSLTMSLFALPSLALWQKLSILVGIFALSVYTYISGKMWSRLDSDFWSSCTHSNMVLEKISDLCRDYSAGMDIRLYDMGGRISEFNMTEQRSLWNRSAQIEKKKLLWRLPDRVLSELLRFGLYALLIAAALSGGVSVGSIAQYVSTCFLMLGGIETLVSAMERCFANNAYLARYFSYFDIPNEMYQGSLTLEKRDDSEYDVEFRDVSFRYPNTEEYALRHVNIKFKVGEKLAIVGMNGSGKTTMIKLMCRLYDPTEGEILLNGLNIKKYDYDEYMAAFSVVFQDFKLLAMTLGQNVAAANEYDEQKVRECLYKAGFGDRFDTLEKGCETYLYKDYSNDGIEISGGEAQKIALARALYKDAPFIILDEPTSALDPMSEYEVYSKFNEISGDKTAIYISHRLASCRFCDKIAVFDRGSIVQVGNHEELLANPNGKYHELWTAQAQYYTE